MSSETSYQISFPKEPMMIRDKEDDEPQPDIDHIAYGFMGSKGLFAAIRAGIFDAIDSVDGPAKLNEIESACGGIS